LSDLFKTTERYSGQFRTQDRGFLGVISTTLRLHY